MFQSQGQRNNGRKGNYVISNCSKCNVHVYTRICSKSQYICFCMCICLLLLSLTLFACHFLPHCKVSEGIACISACVTYFVHQSASVSLLFHLLKLFAFRDQHNYFLDQTIADDLRLVTCDVVCLSVFWSVSSKDIHSIYALYFRGTWNSSCYRSGIARERGRGGRLENIKIPESYQIYVRK